MTDEFIAHIRARARVGPRPGDGFLVVAATLLDLKAARLLPAAEVEDEEDLALLEARDLLFARLLQYRRLQGGRRLVGGPAWPTRRPASREPSGWRALRRTAARGPARLGPAEFAALAARALTPSPSRAVDRPHPCASGERAGAGGPAGGSLRRVRSTTFRALGRLPGHAHVVARFLALLELFRESAVAFEQVAALGELHVRWAGTDEGDLMVDDEFDVTDA